MAGYSCGSAARTDVPMYPSLPHQPPAGYPTGPQQPPPAYGPAYPPEHPPPQYRHDEAAPSLAGCKADPRKKTNNKSKKRETNGKRTFSIISLANGLAMDATQGDKMQVWMGTGGDAQRFYEDDEGRIHSVLNHWVLESQRGWPYGKGPGSQMMLKPSNHVKQQDWVVWKDTIGNKNNMSDVLEVAVDAGNGSPVIWTHSNKSKKQKWRIQY